jgi:DNA-directed RNA polymerase specialized sigma24 family protein
MMNLSPLTNMVQRIAAALGMRAGLRGPDLEDFVQDVLVEAISKVKEKTLNKSAAELPGYIQSLAVSRLMDRKRKAGYRAGRMDGLAWRQTEIESSRHDQQEQDEELSQHRDSVCLVRRKQRMALTQQEANTMGRLLHNPKADTNLMISMRALAAGLNVSHTTIAKMLREPGAPKPVKILRQNRYKLEVVRVWLKDRGFEVIP